MKNVLVTRSGLAVGLLLATAPACAAEAAVPGVAQPLEAAGDLFHILADVEVPRGSALTFRIRGTPVIVTDQSVACNSKHAPLRPVLGPSRSSWTGPPSRLLPTTARRTCPPASCRSTIA